MVVYVWQGRSVDVSMSWFNYVYLHYYILVCNVVEEGILKEREEITMYLFLAHS